MKNYVSKEDEYIAEPMRIVGVVFMAPFGKLVLSIPDLCLENPNI